MWLKNSPKFRVSFNEKGYYVEIQKTTWYGRKYWAPCIMYNGTQNDIMYYLYFKDAIKQATKYFKWDLISNSREYLNTFIGDLET